MVRLFVGLELDPDIKEALTFARGGVEGARWHTDEQLHLTLAFIGEVPTSSQRYIEEILASVSFNPFELRLEGVDMFGNIRHPRTLWAGVADDEPLQHLHEKIAVALERADVETDRRRYKPHVTLGRFPKGLYARIGEWLNANSVLKTPNQIVSYFSLFSSHRGHDGPSFIVESRFGQGASVAGMADGAASVVAETF